MLWWYRFRPKKKKHQKADLKPADSHKVEISTKASHEGARDSATGGISGVALELRPQGMEFSPDLGSKLKSQETETSMTSTPNQSFMDMTLVLERDLLANSRGSVGALKDPGGNMITHICEDVARLPALLDDHSNFDEIVAMCDGGPDDLKVYGKTRIPAGLYQVRTFYPKDRKRANDEWARSLRDEKDPGWHKYGVMELVGVPGFSYIQFHPGNFPEDSHGCFLPGTWNGRAASVGRSRIAYKPFYMRYAPVADAGRLWLRITDGDMR